MSDSDAGAKKNALGRVEFVAALVVVAINKYVRSGALADVSEAVDRLFTDQIVRKLGPKLPVPDDLRGKHLYTQEVAEVLESHEASLRLIFNTLAEMDRPRNLLSFHMWKTFLRALGFIGVDVTERDATLCFMWSVMAVIDNSTRTGSIKEKNLPSKGSSKRSAESRRSNRCPTIPRSIRLAAQMLGRTCRGSDGRTLPRTQDGEGPCVRMGRGARSAHASLRGPRGRDHDSNHRALR